MPNLANPKQCTKCKALKPRSDFYPHSKAPRGVSSWCRTCTNSMSRAKQKADPSRANATSRKSKLKVYWGMTLEDYDNMLANQNGGCAICATSVPGGKGRFHIDHCHKTGAIRGLLCSVCNVGLGHFRDEAKLLLKAANYLNNGGYLGI